MVNYIDVKDSNSAEEFKNVRDNGQWFVWFHTQRGVVIVEQ